MPIISTIGRKSLKVRLLIAGIFILLIAGALTMLYPFLLMVSGSGKSAMDTPDMELIPRYLEDDNVLWAKYTEGLFNEKLGMLQQVYQNDTISFRKVTPPARPNAKLAEAWGQFITKTPLPETTYTIGFVKADVSKTVPRSLREFANEMQQRFDGNIENLNESLGTDFAGWNSFYLPLESYLLRRQIPIITPIGKLFTEFKARQPVDLRYYFSPEGFYKEYLRTQYGRDIKKYNQSHGTKYKSYSQVHLDRRAPTGPGRTEQELKDWEVFARSILNLLWIRTESNAAPLYRDYLQAKYTSIAGLNRNYGTKYTSFKQIPLIEIPPNEGLALSDWGTFIEGWIDPDTGKTYKLPLDMIRIDSVEFMFRDHLKATYGTLDKANAALGTNHTKWLDVTAPQEDFQYLAFKQQTGDIRWEFVTRNYLAVIDYIVLHGRGIINTAIYCVLAVLGALIVNPLAAYALSRYKPPSAYKVLLFLMLTMAFPPLVTMIPQFLMLREFGMLNTFWALILPGLANGYQIFLLKGFFDSLPKELYESAALDGAGEFRMFWQFTMALSKPILAVIALGAFNIAYANFMFALLICQDEKMWTLMVWLYQLQQKSGQGVIYASLILAAIPTFLMFAFTQNIIMRGIVVPVEK
ncbi:MAG: ABC transporter permease subunit [Phycisphaerae bacterium]|nr:ABC transporter permease subunit [Phycisphaerae bacterium]